MSYGFMNIALTPSVRAAQASMGADHLWQDFKGHREFDRFTHNEAAFIAERDSFYMASVSETGWPYVQHRGGPAGFVRVLDDVRIGFADFRGNRQYVSLGNLSSDDRVSLFFMDYANRTRLKLFGRARVVQSDEPGLLARLEVADYRARVERGIVIAVEAFDWNCPQHITCRFTLDDIQRLTEPFARRIEELEAELARR